MEKNFKSPTHVLLADDDEDDRILFRDSLNELAANVELSTATDGENLMQKLSKEEIKLPDVIFLDLNMPRKTGLECLAEIRGSKKFENIPVIIFSTSASHKDIAQTYSSGANLYVHKPFRFDDQVEILKRVFALNWEENRPYPLKDKFFIDTVQRDYKF